MTFRAGVTVQLLNDALSSSKLFTHGAGHVEWLTLPYFLLGIALQAERAAFKMKLL